MKSYSLKENQSTISLIDNLKKTVFHENKCDFLLPLSLQYESKHKGSEGKIKALKRCLLSSSV